MLWMVRVRHDLRETEVARAIQMLQDGSSQQNVAATFRVSHTVLS